MTYTLDVVEDAETVFAAVRDEVEWQDLMRSRRTASMGRPYNYKGASYPVGEWRPQVQQLREVVAERVGFMPTNCLLNYYPTGWHSLGWHHDDTEILAPGTGIAIVSLGARRPLSLRRRDEAGEYVYEAIELAPGSLLYMSAAMQSIWQHRLKRVPGDAPRISLSFRHIVRWTTDGTIVGASTPPADQGQEHQ